MCRNKIRFGLAGIVALTISSPLFAADMPVKAPPLTPTAAVYDWTGVYVGGEVGGKWTKDNWNTTCVDAGGAPLGLCGSPVSLAAFPGAPDSTAANTFKTSGLRAGVYAGLDIQVSPSWVVGIEGDWAGYKKSSTVPGILGCSTAACTGGALVPFSLGGDFTSVKFGDDYSVRLRAGYLVTPDRSSLRHRRYCVSTHLRDAGLHWCYEPGVSLQPHRNSKQYALGLHGRRWPRVAGSAKLAATRRISLF